MAMMHVVIKITWIQKLAGTQFSFSAVDR